MNTRTSSLRAIRPETLSETINGIMSSEEYFQNSVLRPVIEFQNDLYIEVFKNYAAKHKYVFYDLTVTHKLAYIENAILKDVKFRNTLKGITIGQFTVEEYSMYIKNSSALNKRMMQLVSTRLQDQIQLLELSSEKAL